MSKSASCASNWGEFIIRPKGSEGSEGLEGSEGSKASEGSSRVQVREPSEAPIGPKLQSALTRFESKGRETLVVN